MLYGYQAMAVADFFTCLMIGRLQKCPANKSARMSMHIIVDLSADNKHVGRQICGFKQGLSHQGRLC